MTRPDVAPGTVTVSTHQVGSTGDGFLVLDSDDPTAYDGLVRRAAKAPGVG